MKKWVVAGFVALAALAVTANAGEAWYRWSGGVYVGAGPWYWPGPFYGYGYGYYRPYSYGPYPYGPYGYGTYGYGVYDYPSTLVVEPPVYIERPPAAPPAPPPQPPLAYWYYCVSAGGYYPDVQSCPEEWVKVPPRDR